jgi:amino acid transporter
LTAVLITTTALTTPITATKISTKTLTPAHTAIFVPPHPTPHTHFHPPSHSHTHTLTLTLTLTNPTPKQTHAHTRYDVLVAFSVLKMCPVAILFLYSYLWYRVKRPDLARPFRIPGGHIGAAMVVLPVFCVTIAAFWVGTVRTHPHVFPNS